MPYIGKTPTVGNFQVCDAISVVNGQAAYTLQVGGTNVAPESANHMLVSLNGILQKPGSSFTISGSTMTFASNLATGDVIDFVQILGNVLDLGTPSDDTVTAAKLNNDIISGQTALTSAPDDTDEFLVSDAGTIKRIDYSLIKGGIEEIDMFRVTSAYSGYVDPITSNWERADSDNFTKLGTGLTNSSGIFSFPSTGYYYVIFQANFNKNGDRRGIAISINLTEDNSSFTAAATGSAFIKQTESDATTSMATCSTVVHCDDVSNVKISFSAGGTSTNTLGNTNAQETGFTVFKLAET
jgi:hypothetical protein